jgi:hypothetical protein
MAILAAGTYKGHSNMLQQLANASERAWRQPQLRPKSSPTWDIDNVLQLLAHMLVKAWPGSRCQVATQCPDIGKSKHSAN